MLPLEKSLIQRLGDAGWVLYWLPRLHSLSKIYTVKTPSYRKEAHKLVKSIDNDIANFHRREKKDLKKRKDLPIDNSRHLGREAYLRAVGTLNKKRDTQATKFIRDNIRIAAQEVELNLIWDAFEYGIDAYITGDYSLSDGSRFMRTYLEQNNPPQAGERLASLYHEVRRHIKQRRRDWVPNEMGYIEEFLRSVKQHYRRLGKVAYWDGVDYRVILERDDLPPRESRHQARASELNDVEITKIMDVLFFKFERHPDFPLSRKEYDRLKGVIIANYDFTSQLGQKNATDGVPREYYIKPAITSIKV